MLPSIQPTQFSQTNCPFAPHCLMITVIFPKLSFSVRLTRRRFTKLGENVDCKCGTQKPPESYRQFWLDLIKSLLSTVGPIGLRPRQSNDGHGMCSLVGLKDCDAHVLKLLHSTARKKRGPPRPSRYIWRPRRVITAIMAPSSLGGIWLPLPSPRDVDSVSSRVGDRYHTVRR